MKRRSFIRNISAATVPFALNGIPFNLLGSHKELQRLAADCPNDRVLIILQMHGGNDGLNTLIPVAGYDTYFHQRANIAIPSKGNRRYISLDSTLPDDQKVGLHPDMIGVKELYDNGKIKLVQSVSYPLSNGSHFRGRDIMFMGGGANEYYDSGWVGRYLTADVSPNIYPRDFPLKGVNEDPLALEFGNEVSLLFHQKGNIPASISIDNPEGFFNLVDKTLVGFEDNRNEVDKIGIPPEVLSGSNYYDELNWILSLEDKSKDYAKRLHELYQAGLKYDPKVTYPETYPFGTSRNPLSGQLKIIANLINGGSKTKVYLIKIGGFDTHARQVEKYDATLGLHAALLYHISSAMKAFQEDLGKRGIEHRVLTITTSEFGRRIASNGSYGTDHGEAWPMMIFGPGVIPGMLGKSPLVDANEVDQNGGNVGLQYDYRQIFSSIMKDWMCVDPNKVDATYADGGVFPPTSDNYSGQNPPLAVVNKFFTETESFIIKRFKMNNCYPNPASNYTTISFYVNNDSTVNITILDQTGRTVKEVLNSNPGTGEHKLNVDLRNLAPGMYFYHIKAGILEDTKKLTIIR